MSKFIIIFIFMYGCYNSDSKTDVKNKSVDILNKSSDSSIVVDSLKWLFYALNSGEGESLFYDSTTKQKIRLNPVTCEIEMAHCYKSGDTTIYFFSFTKDKNRLQYIDMLDFTKGFLVTKKDIIPIKYSGIKYDFQKNSVSLKNFLSNNSKLFSVYLKNYTGPLSDFLREEIIKRKLKK